MIEERAGSNSARGESGEIQRAIRHVSRAVAPVLLASTAGQVSAQDNLQRDLDTILSSEDYQRSLPEHTPQNIEIPDQIPSVLSFLESLAPVFEVLFWMLVVVGTILLLYALYRAITTYLDSRAQTQPLPTAESGPAAARDGEAPRTAFDEIEALASAGAFGEAVHLLLLLCFEELRRERPALRDTALTSREFLARATLPKPVQEGLAYIVSAVELGHFGGRRITRATYERCLDGYRNVTANQIS